MHPNPHPNPQGMPPIEVKEPGGEGPSYPYPRADQVSVRRLPRDYVLFSLLNFFYGNCCCLGLAALFFSIKSRDSKVIGDVEGAEEHGKTARWLNVIAVSLAIGSFIITIIVLAITRPVIYHMFQEAIADAHNNSSKKFFSSN